MYQNDILLLLQRKLFDLFSSKNFIPLMFLFIIFTIGVYCQLSVISEYYLIYKYFLRWFIAFICLFIFYAIDIKLIISYSYLCYVMCLILLIFVELLGTVKLGAKRWINLYAITIQPSELMKFSILLALARYYSDADSFKLSRARNHIIPILIFLIPALLILHQPDLGTAILIVFNGFLVIFMAGFPLRKFFSLAFSCISCVPIAWFFLHEYQKNRIRIFLNPESDPLGKGYHIMQSKIAIGSGGLFGKGFNLGSQSQLDFLPEKHTDFIFTCMCEENGLIGAIIIIIAIFTFIVVMLFYSKFMKLKFGTIFCFGLAFLIFAHASVNIGMVTGIIPVVGVPLPFLSYGGSALITFLSGFGLILNANNFNVRD